MPTKTIHNIVAYITVQTQIKFFSGSKMFFLEMQGVIKQTYFYGKAIDVSSSITSALEDKCQQPYLELCGRTKNCGQA